MFACHILIVQSHLLSIWRVLVISIDILVVNSYCYTGKSKFLLNMMCFLFQNTCPSNVYHNLSCLYYEECDKWSRLPPDFQECFFGFCPRNIILPNIKKMVEHKLHLQLSINVTCRHVDYWEFISLFNASVVEKSLSHIVTI